MLTNPGWLLSKTWAWGARLPFSLYIKQVREYKKIGRRTEPYVCFFSTPSIRQHILFQLVYASTRQYVNLSTAESTLQKGGVPAAPSGTATLLRLSPTHRFCLRPTLAVTDFRHPRLSWLDGRCVQGPGTYSPRHG